MDFITKILPEIFYALCGLVSISTAFYGLKNEKNKQTTFAFWFILGMIFIFGKYIPPYIVGALLLLMSGLTVTKSVNMPKFEDATKSFKEESASRIGNKIFIPAVLIGTVAVLVSFFKVGGKPLASITIIGLGCLASYLAALAIAKPKFEETKQDTAKLLMQVGSAALLTQLLGALGTLFTKAGVGTTISEMVVKIVPADSVMLGIVTYCLGMMIFTMIMGNAFAAFSVITLGVGIPFVISAGGNPAVVAALGMTSGYCGTLLTPMAANFNIVSGSVLETRDKWTVIKTQAPVALVMIVVHIILMRLLAF